MERKSIALLFNWLANNNTVFNLTGKTIDWDNFPFDAPPKTQEIYLTKYVTFNNATIIEEIKHKSNGSYIWALLPYINEIKHSLSKSFNDSDDFWRSVQWGFDIRKYLFSISFKIERSDLIPDFAQTCLWKSALASGGSLKLTRTEPQTSNLTLPNIFTFEEGVVISINQLLSSGFKPSLYHGEVTEDIVLNVEMVSDLLNFQEKRIELIEIHERLRTNKIDEILASTLTPDINSSTPKILDSVSDYELCLSKIHEDGIVVHNGTPCRVKDITTISEIPKTVNKDNLMNTKTSVNNKLVDIHTILEQLTKLTEIIFNSNEIQAFNRGRVTLKEELPYITSKFNVNGKNIRIAKTKHKFKDFNLIKEINSI